MHRIRPATPEDADQMLEIYRPYVLETAISFETHPPSAAEFRERIAETSKNYPWLAFDQEGVVLGYAYASSHRTRSAYQWTAESTVYVKKGEFNRGIGRELYRALLENLKNRGIVNVIAGIALPNEASVRLHESMGYKQVAVFKDVGFKVGQWWDVGYWQLQLQRPAEPKPIRGIQASQD